MLRGLENKKETMHMEQENEEQSQTGVKKRRKFGNERGLSCIGIVRETHAAGLDKHV